MKTPTLIALALAFAAMGIYGVSADDKPGSVVVATLLMVVGLLVGLRAARGRLAASAARIALLVGIVVAGSAALLIHHAVVTAPLFAHPQAVPSVAAVALAPQYAAAVDRARELARAAVWEQNLPGVSVAVGAGGAVVWSEGFGWRDIATRTPVTPNTRFNIGTAAPAVASASASLGLANTGADSATEWSPGHIGEPEEDFPGFTFLRHVIFQPLGLAPPDRPLPGDRATFYVPATQWRGDTTDPREGRRLMYMRDLACCVNKMAFYSTPSDLVRVALATNANSVNGELAGGMVMSLLAIRDRGIVVAVTSNIAHASTSTLAQGVGDAFAERR